MRALTLALLAVSACSKIIGIDDVTLRDAKLGPPPNTVIGRSYTRYLTSTGVADVHTDLSQALIQALLPDPAQLSGYRVAAGTGKADGTFTIPDVPDDTPYLFKLDTSYFATTFHDLDLHSELPVRGDPAPTLLSSSTTATFNVQGMTPFVNGPEGTFSVIEVHSLNLGYQGGLAPLSNNARALAMPYDWDSGFSIVGGAQPLPDAALGDDLTLLHLRNDIIASPSGRKQRLARLVDTFTPVGVAIRDGMATNISGTWVPAGTTRSINLSITRGIFDAGYDGTSQFGDMRVSLLAHPVRNDFDIAATVFSLDLSDWSRSGALNENLGFMYSDPFPTGWSRTVVVSYDRLRFFRLSGTTSTLSISTSNRHAFPYTGGDPSTVPALQPPANVKVADKNASSGGIISFNGVGSVDLIWNAVAVAKLYTVRVDRVFQNGNQTQRVTVARLSTTQTSIKIPGEVFTGGELFVFAIAAVQTPSDYNAGQLIPNDTPNSIAETVSGLFRLSPRCGNGVLDPGEQCDTAGESAMCDIDCTVPVCGDGIRNATIGEGCDTVRDTTACDVDCTLPVCGDGHLNPALEDCDDSNAIDNGNGCSSACRFNNICGDGTRQSLVEACDPGAIGADTLTCDADCTLPLCGDGHRNATANEQCDDGNTDNTDGCSTSCQAN